MRYKRVISSLLRSADWRASSLLRIACRKRSKNQANNPPIATNIAMDAAEAAVSNTKENRGGI